MTAQFIDQPLIAAIDSIIGPAWRQVVSPLRVPPGHVLNAAGVKNKRLLASPLFSAIRSSDLVVEARRRNDHGIWSAPERLGAEFWRLNVLRIDREPPWLSHRISARIGNQPAVWTIFGDAVVREPVAAAELVPKSAQPGADKRSRRSPASLQMESELVALLAAGRQFSSQADARHLVLTRLSIKKEAHGYGREAFAAIWNRLVKSRQ